MLKSLTALVAFSACCCTIAVAQSPSGPNAQLGLVGGTIYISPTANPIRDAVVLIQNGKIAGVGSRTAVRLPQGIPILDCSGLTIVAGLSNSHVHFFERKWAGAASIPGSDLDRQLQAMLTRYGFTSVWDTWSMWENTRRIRERIESGEIPGPRIRWTGEAIFGRVNTAGMGATWSSLGFMPLESFQISQVADPTEGLAAAKKLLDAGTDGVKFYAATPGRSGVVIPQSAIEAGTREAHSRGKPVFAHPSTAAGLIASVNAGVDVVAHTTPQSGAWDEGVLSAMMKAGVALIPTLKRWNYEFRHEPISLGDGFKKTAESQLRAWVASRGVVLFGTDVGYMSEYDPTEEYVLMAEAGMTFQQILASLTTAPAQKFGESGRLGRIALGLTADLTVLRDDLSWSIEAPAAVQYTLRDGKIIYRRN